MHRAQKLRCLTDALIYLCIAIAIGSCIAVAGRHGIQVNADSFAGITLAQSIHTVGGIGSAKFARIPSFLPDLLLLGFIPREFSVLDVYRIYAIGIGTLFLASGAEFIYISTSKALSRINCLGLAAFTALVFARYSPFYRQSLGILLSPVHHGGNILMTIVSGLLYFRLQSEKSNTSKALTGYIFVVALISGILSNRIFLFTGLAPLALTALISAKGGGMPRGWCLTALKDNQHKALLFALLVALSLFLTHLVYGYLNIQCSPDVELNPEWTIASSLEFMWKHPSLYGAYLSSFLLVYPNSRRKIAIFLGSIMQRGSLISQDLLLAGMTFLSLASASWGGYLFILGEQEIFQPRYIISGILLLPFLLLLAISPMIITVVPTRLRAFSLPFTAFLGIAIISNLNGMFSRRQLVFSDDSTSEWIGKHREPSQQLRNEKAGIIFAPFWDVEVGIYLDRHVTVLPVGGDGLPDIWAHGRSLFTKAIKKMETNKNPIFYYSSSSSLPSGLIKAWGIPDEAKKTKDDATGQEYLILKYTEENKRRRILSGLSHKLRTYSQNCNRQSALFMER